MIFNTSCAAARLQDVGLRKVSLGLAEAPGRGGRGASRLTAGGPCHGMGAVGQEVIQVSNTGEIILGFLSCDGDFLCPFA